jgi:hypothetical protein
MIPKSKKAAIREVYQDSDGIWISLHEGWNADGMDSDCHIIHCGGEDEEDRPNAASLIADDLKYQISMIRKL